MEFKNEEITAVNKAVIEGVENDSRTLSEYELALIGGGIGDVIVG
jgi:hypothetical protein